MSASAADQRLALFGGPKAITMPFRRYNPIGLEETDAARRVVDSGVLSQFIGAWDPDFYGGVQVREFERQWANYFDVKHAVTVNSATSGLIAAVGALGIEPGDEVIVSPWTMCASATAILMWNAIPVFADIESETYCLDPRSVEANITPHTRAIMAVDIFGHSANMQALSAIARKHNLKIISDTAQAPGAYYKGKYAGTLADIGCFSLNYHKHIHTGEGGVLVTNDDHLAERLQLIRNHGEAVVEDKGVSDIVNIVGYNFRLGEIESAIGIEQLKKLQRLVGTRRHIADRLTRGLAGFPGLRTPQVVADCTHAYYVYPLTLDTQKLGVSAARIAQALKAEGLTGVSAGYQNVHLLPIYQRKIAYGSRGFPWSSDICRRPVDYRKGICPNAERLHDRDFLGFASCLHDLSDGDVDLMLAAFAKVWSSLEALRT
jgi:dTDP-4-amino-4,6-dideoxygalactose transaminase